MFRRVRRLVMRCALGWRRPRELIGVGIVELRKHERVTGPAREALKADLKRRYAAGESIRELASATGRSYGFVHRLLTEAGALLRPRGRGRKVVAAACDAWSEAITAFPKGEGDRRQADGRRTNRRPRGPTSLIILSFVRSLSGV